MFRAISISFGIGIIVVIAFSKHAEEPVEKKRQNQVAVIKIGEKHIFPTFLVKYSKESIIDIFDNTTHCQNVSENRKTISKVTSIMETNCV